MIKYKITDQWLAGFIDGEGCFNVTRTRTTILPRLLIVNTNIDILRSIQAKYGGDISSRQHKSNWKAYNCYRASYKTFKQVIKDVLPHLTIKKDVATICCKMLETKDMKEREKMREAVKAMNKKGV